MKKRLLAILLGASLALTGLTACGGSTEETESQEAAFFETDWTDVNLDVETRIAALVSQMTLEEKAGQMIQAEQAAITPEEVTEYYIGCVFSGGGSAPSTGNTAEDWEARVNELKEAALETRLGIPLVYGIDSVHGNNNVYGSVIYPHNSALGAANDTELMGQIGTAVAEETRAIGVQWAYSPCLANPQDVTWGRSYEGYSEEASDIGPLAAAYIKGLQGDLTVDGATVDATHVIACAKHFIGEGYTADGENQGNVEMTDEEFDELLSMGVLDPYEQAVDAGVLTVMASYNSVNGVKCHENYHLLTEVLKDQLGFKGLVSGDYNAIQQLSGTSYKQQVALAINAGVDLVMEPTDWKEVLGYIIDNVNDGTIPMERIDDAVTRILRVKMIGGLFEEEIASETEQELLAEFGSDEHREIARQAVRESLVCLKNETVGDVTAIEALSDASNITICGQAAYDMGLQCGGWTISWQGQEGTAITEGTTVIQGIYDQVKDHAQVAQKVDGTVVDGTDAVVVVVTEEPYAEMYGDREPDTLNLRADDTELLANLSETLAGLDESVPKILVVMTGRPVNISEYTDEFDGIVMAWLPGSEGEGIADVLFGEYDFSGTLSYTWHVDESEDVLYPYGYGLNKAGEELTRS